MPATMLKGKELLKAAEKLDPEELQTFVKDVLALRARKAAPALSAKETRLLKQINESIPPETWKRYKQLERKRRQETLTPGELRELIQITDRSEQLAARRLRALTALAILRKTSVQELMDRLGIKSLQHG